MLKLAQAGVAYLEQSVKIMEPFVSRLNQKAGTNKYRLPTEVEWVYAARAGSSSAWYGDINDFAWYDRNSGSRTHTVGQKSPNAWSLYDMLGNVWDWYMTGTAIILPDGS
jgi:formylglycine-generating enzyme required for sulfatase activity